MKVNLDLIRGKRVEILRNLDIGDPAGESDRLLADCRIETTAFNDILNNKKDIILGPKGAGKSSLYTLFTRPLKQFMFTELDVVVLKGIASVGSPIYTEYWGEFENFTDNDFQNFWNILFINIIYREYILNVDLCAESKAKEFEELCKKHSIFLENEEEDKSLLQKAIDRVKKISAKGSAGTKGVSGEIEVSIENNSEKVSQNSSPARIKTREILNFVINHLEWKGHTIWIFIDQLDQAFERRSATEQKALHGLLTEALNFNDERLKLKIFLRDDVFEFITHYKGIVNADHLRISDSLKWDDIFLLKLLLKRLLHNQRILSCVEERDELHKVDEMHREECFQLFYSFFPPLGSKGSEFWSYMMRELRDGHEFVTPRDLILLIDYAREYQLNLINAGEGGVYLFSKKSFEDALVKVSKQKITNYLYSEFPYLKETVDKLKDQWNKYDEKQLSALIGKDRFKQKTDQLISIGVIYIKKESDVYWIAPLYQRGLGIKNRKAKKVSP